MYLSSIPAQGQFSDRKVISPIDRLTSIYSADLDGDGNVDVLSASADDNKIAWYENDGSGS